MLSKKQMLVQVIFILGNYHYFNCLMKVNASYIISIISCTCMIRIEKLPVSYVGNQNKKRPQNQQKSGRSIIVAKLHNYYFFTQ